MNRKTEDALEAVWSWVAPPIIGLVAMAGPPLLLTAAFWLYERFYNLLS